MKLEQLVHRLIKQDRYFIERNVHLADGVKFLIPSGEGVLFGNDDASKIGFFGVPPVAQPPGDTAAVGHFGGSGTAVKHDDVWTGSDVGSTGWSINGILDALKDLGLLQR